MNMDYLRVETVDGVVRVTCDKQSEQSIRQGLLRQNIELSESKDCLFMTKRLNDLVEFNALSATLDDVGFALADSLKITRPYPQKGVLKVGELEDSGD